MKCKIWGLLWKKNDKPIDYLIASTLDINKSPANRIFYRLPVHSVYVHELNIFLYLCIAFLKRTNWHMVCIIFGTFNHTILCFSSHAHTACMEIRKKKLFSMPWFDSIRLDWIGSEITLQNSSNKNNKQSQWIGSDILAVLYVAIFSPISIKSTQQIIK